MKKYILATPLLSLLFAFSTEAQVTLNWVGSTDTDWATAANWNQQGTDPVVNAVPTAADIANIYDRTSQSGNQPVVSTSGQAAKNLWIRASSMTVSAGDLTVGTAGGDLRLGAFAAGSANLFVNGGTLTSNGLFYIAQGIDTGGSKLTLNDGLVDINSDLRIGSGATGVTNAAGVVEVNGGTLDTQTDIYLGQGAGSTGSLLTLNTGGSVIVGNSLRVGYAEAGDLVANGGSLTSGAIFVAQLAGSAGSTMTLSGGTLSTTGNLHLGYAGAATMRIEGSGATITLGNFFEFGRNGAPTLEFILATDGTVSPIVTKLSLGQLAEGLSRTLTVDASNVPDPQSISGVVLFRAPTESAFGQSQVDTLNSNLSLVNLSGFSLALANGNTEIVLVPDSPPQILITDAFVNASNEFVIDFVGAPSSNYEVKKSTALSGFNSLTVPLIESTDAGGIGQAIVPAGEMGEAKQFFLLEDAP